jgi:hypothetical protein
MKKIFILTYDWFYYERTNYFIQNVDILSEDILNNITLCYLYIFIAAPQVYFMFIYEEFSV